MNAAELLVRCLENEGVRFIFGLPGEENMDVLDALLDSSITFIQVGHEQAAAFMADVHGRLTGDPGVCLATLGPGATNLITGVADAQLDSAPLVAITGQAALERQHKESHQLIDTVHIFERITKWNASIVIPEIVPETVRKAFKLARSERPGATHLELPEDVAREAVEGTPLKVQQATMPEPSRERLDVAASLIAAAERPIILAGNGAIRARASRQLLALASATNLPVVTTLMAKGAIPDSAPQALGATGFAGGDRARIALQQADLVVAAGYDLIEWSPKNWNPNRDKQIVSISPMPAEVDANYIVSVGVIGDIGLALEALASQLMTKRDWGWDAIRRRIRDEQHAMATNDAFPMRPERVLAGLRSVLAGEDVLVSDTGAHKVWVARDFPCEQPNTCIISNGFATMGIGLPGAIAAKLTYPERRSVTVSGDGGFRMNASELATAARYGIPCVSIVMNDGRYGLIEMKQRRRFGRPAFVDLQNPDFKTLATAYGARGYRLSAASELCPALEEALTAGVPAVIDVAIDPQAAETLG